MSVPLATHPIKPANLIWSYLSRPAAPASMDFLQLDEEDIELDEVPPLSVYCCDLHCAQDEDRFRKDSALNLINTLESLGTRNARRLSHSIQKHSLFSPSRSLRSNSLNSDTIINTIYEEEQESSLDEIFEIINPMGRYQKLVIVLIVCGAAPILGIQEFLLKSQSVIPEWTCTNPDVTCYPPHFKYSPYNDNVQILCGLNRTVWQWDNVLTNAISQWDIACSYHRTVLDVIYFIPGGVLGAIAGVQMSNRLGRRLSFLFFMIATLVSGTLISSSKYYLSYLVLKLVMGASVTGLHLSNYIWLLENFSYSFRGRTSYLYFLGTFILVPIIALLNYTSLSWNYIHLASVISLILGVFVFFHMLESPRWLVVHDDTSAMDRVLRSIASTNATLKDLPTRCKLPSLTEYMSVNIQVICRKENVLFMTTWVCVLVYHNLQRRITFPMTNVFAINETAQKSLGVPMLLLLALFLGDSLKRGGSVILLIFFIILLTVINAVYQQDPSSTLHRVCGHAIVYVLLPSLYATLSLWAAERTPTEGRAAVVGCLLAVQNMIQAGFILASEYVSFISNYHIVDILSTFLLFGATCSTLFAEETFGKVLLEFESQRFNNEKLKVYQVLLIPLRKVKKHIACLLSKRRLRKSEPKYEPWRRFSPILF